MKHGLGQGKRLGTIQICPTFGEGNKFVAGNWRKARKPEGLLRWVERYHQWMSALLDGVAVVRGDRCLWSGATLFGKEKTDEQSCCSPGGVWFL